MRRARLVLIGLGGLGCPASLALCEESRARSLPLELVLVDDDRVERSNLSRQLLYGEEDVGRPKVEAARARLLQLVPGADVQLTLRAQRFDADSAGALLAGADLLLDGCDSPATRFLANDLACAAGVPLVHGAVLGWSGQLLTVLPGGPCLRCLFEGPPPPGGAPACAEAGVVSPLCGLVGAAMAEEAVRLVLARQLRAAGRLLRWDGLRGTLRPLPIPRAEGCAGCGRSAREARC